MRSIGTSRELATAELILIEAVRIAKIANPSCMIGISEDDIDYMVKNLANEYLKDDIVDGKRTLDNALAGFASLAQRESKINLGDFLRLCYSEASQVKEDKRTRDLIAMQRIPSRREVVAEKFSEIKEMLKNAVKPLPYDKNMREPLTSKYEHAGDGSDKMNHKELTKYLHTTRIQLHNDLVSYGQIRHFTDVENPELRALYYKAWTDGITREEKDRMAELGRMTGDKIVGL